MLARLSLGVSSSLSVGGETVFGSASGVSCFGDGDGDVGLPEGAEDFSDIPAAPSSAQANVSRGEALRSAGCDDRDVELQAADESLWEFMRMMSWT